MRTKVAVYGSLREGLHNHQVLGDSPLLGNDKLSSFSMYSLGSYPFVVPDAQSKEIQVEVYDVEPNVFKALDRLEGYPSFYDRKEVNTAHGKAWIYFMASDNNYVNSPEVENGDWKEYYYS